jgi:hypothetical protein
MKCLHKHEYYVIQCGNSGSETTSQIGGRRIGVAVWRAKDKNGGKGAGGREGTERRFKYNLREVLRPPRGHLYGEENIHEEKYVSAFVACLLLSISGLFWRRNCGHSSRCQKKG